MPGKEYENFARSSRRAFVTIRNILRTTYSGFACNAPAAGRSTQINEPAENFIRVRVAYWVAARVHAYQALRVRRPRRSTSPVRTSALDFTPDRTSSPVLLAIAIRGLYNVP